MGESRVSDIFVVGGGVNGCGIARDAAGRGYSVRLAEQGDLAGATSSGSTKLIHGGLRYLEFYEFTLVRKALLEREVLWRLAPHIIRPLRFILPHHKGLRPAWLLRLGLFLYDHLGGRKLLPGTRTVNMAKSSVGHPLKKLFSKGFEYSDAWVDDARLVVLNARDAAHRGADILVRTKVISAYRDGDLWSIITENTAGDRKTWQARLLVNAAGPWVDRFVNEALDGPKVNNVRLVKGSHIVVSSLFGHGHSYIFQNQDGRIIFAIPFEGSFTLIGTTDLDFGGDPGAVEISKEEIAYLCQSASEYFTQGVRPEDVVWAYSAVRPLFDDGAQKAQQTTRDYVYRTVTENDTLPLINIFGGKITTYRKLAESILEEVEKWLEKKGAPWTANAPLPGGDFPTDGFGAEVVALMNRYPFLEKTHAKRLVRLYGTMAKDILGRAKDYDDLGENFGSNLYAAEVTYLMENEWARTSEDILWRRTKEGLRISPEGVAALERYLAESAASK